MSDELSATNDEPQERHIPYREVNALWPETIPKLTGDEAIRAAKLLMKEGLRFHKKKRKVDWKWKLTSGNRRNHLYQIPRIINPDAGWHSLVHSCSHWVHSKVHPTWEQHQLHAITEKHLIEYVLKNGWLDGKLKRPEKPKPVIDHRALRKQRAEQALERWQRKAKRAETAIRKLRKTLRYYQKT